MEPLIKSENYNFTFYKKMLEKIKQSKDAVCPDSDEANQVYIMLSCRSLKVISPTGCSICYLGVSASAALLLCESSIVHNGTPSFMPCRDAVQMHVD